MRTCLALLLLVATPLMTAAQPAQDAMPAIFVEDSMASGNGVADMLRSVFERQKRIVSGVRLFVPLSGDDEGVKALDARLTHYPAGTPIWLFVPGPADAASTATWRATLQRVLAIGAPRSSALEVAVHLAPPDLAAFALRVAATEARALNPQIQIAFGEPPPVGLEQLPARTRARSRPMSTSSPHSGDGFIEQAATFLEHVDPAAAIVSTGIGVSEPSRGRHGSASDS